MKRYHPTSPKYRNGYASASVVLKTPLPAEPASTPPPLRTLTVPEVDTPPTPYLPVDLVPKLPSLLRMAFRTLTDDRERDAVLLASLGVLSACFPTVEGVYDGRRVAANLYVFLIAPAATGKGCLGWARLLGEAYHRHKILLSEEHKRRYQHLQQEARRDRQPFEEEPPPFRSFYLPGNSSAAAIIKALAENEGTGIIFESEADTLSGALTQDWGNFSDLLRKAFHHEAVSYLRKGGGERYEIERPALSLVLSGTPSQVATLIPDAENGLFSRFLFYRYHQVPIWRNVAPVVDPRRPPIEKTFREMSHYVQEMTLYYGERRTSFVLTAGQWQALNQRMALRLQESVARMGEGGISTVKRLGLITFRIAMLLSVLRAHEDAQAPYASGAQPPPLDSGGAVVLTCEDLDLEIALALSGTLLEHAEVVAEALPSVARSGRKAIPQMLVEFGNRLPPAFSRAGANEVGEQLGLSERTVYNYLTRLVEQGHLARAGHGQFTRR